MKNWNALMQSDQLTREMSFQRTFCDFQEGKIKFMPTYRLERGSNEWSKKKLQNVPSYCDRILWKSLPPNELIQHEYNSVESIMTSDHRPVLSTFSCKVRLANISSVDDISFVQLVGYDFEITKVNEANYPQKKD